MKILLCKFRRNKNSITNNTRAIIVVHLFGMIIEDIDKIQVFVTKKILF